MYDFRTLSPIDFELFARDLLQAELSITMESFGPGKDGGIDFRFAAADQDVVVQAKHYVEGGPRSPLQAAMKEDSKVLKLAPGRYILVTSLSLTPELKRKIVQAMPSTPLSAGDVIGREDLNNFLGHHPQVLRQHFKLLLTSTVVLERILHSAVFEACLEVNEPFLRERSRLAIWTEPGVPLGNGLAEILNSATPGTTAVRLVLNSPNAVAELHLSHRLLVACTPEFLANLQRQKWVKDVQVYVPTQI
ncbi:MAG: restriction endonuclease [Betaproteobacteria bacterium]|nr:restriction endonuclease [Betaproteobacteria bacterium]